MFCKEKRGEGGVDHTKSGRVMKNVLLSPCHTSHPVCVILYVTADFGMAYF